MPCRCLIDDIILSFCLGCQPLFEVLCAKSAFSAWCHCVEVLKGNVCRTENHIKILIFVESRLNILYLRRSNDFRFASARTKSWQSMHRAVTAAYIRSMGCSPVDFASIFFHSYRQISNQSPESSASLGTLRIQFTIIMQS